MEVRRANAKDSIPVEPIRRVMSAWLERRRADHYGLSSPHTRSDPSSGEKCDLAVAIWPDRSPEVSIRRIHEILHRQRTVSFDEADRILCRLGEQMLWITDPELSDAYQSVDLRSLDMAKPTSPVVDAANRDLVTKTYARLQSQERTARELGCSRMFVGKVVEVAA